MALDRMVKRYSAYYTGWCVAFGEHEIAYEQDKDIQWVFGEAKVGITLAPKLRRLFIRELLGQHGEIPRITLGETSARINHLEYPVTEAKDLEALSRFREFFRCRDDIHMFLTSHFCYPPGTRIIKHMLDNQAHCADDVML